MEKNFDFGIIGAGPAGFTAALLAAEKGYSVVLFEKEHIGGTCLNKGCIPTKTILHSADLYKDIKNAENIGIITNELNFDFSNFATIVLPLSFSPIIPLNFVPSSS